MAVKVEEDMHTSDLSEDENFDEEVAAVLSRGIKRESCESSPSKQFNTSTKHSYSPFRPSTALTNITRGNIRTLTPCLQALTIHQMSAQGELLMLKEDLHNHHIDRQDESGFTPILWAAAHNQVRTVEFLISRGADVNITGHQEETPLLFASAYGYSHVVNLLLKAGADVNHKCMDTWNPACVEEMLKIAPSINLSIDVPLQVTIRQNGNSALLLAVCMNHVDCVEILMEWGADVTVENRDEHSALHIAVMNNYREVQHVIERHLLGLLERG